MKQSKINTKLKVLCIIITFLTLTGALYAQNDFPGGNYWALNGGLGMSDLLVKGQSFQLIIEPNLWLSPLLMVGTKVGINYSTDEILTFEGQVYLRLNFLRFPLEEGSSQRTVNVFGQLGLGLISAYRGDVFPFDQVTMTRGSVMADAALGVTIPLTQRWHIEPLVRGGYPHLYGFSLTAGYRFPLPQSRTIMTAAPPAAVHERVEVVEIIRRLPPREILNRIMIAAVEFIIFGPDIGSFNVGIDRDAQELNQMVLNYIAGVLKDNPDHLVRIEGHVNPYTISHYELDELSVLSAMRSEAVAEQLRQRGVSDEQMVIISFGGARTITSDFDIRNRNRRVELILVQVNTD
ncbi:MAG: OmpA family protein [Treponema sp.]|nr:OmpA family protein [Treponema sp.]